ncbi:MAG: rod shape-determining protein RodA [Bacteroidales bacterium]|nr:rod shape-determining protein RodA [Bacteroidales bacterium]
MMDGRAQRSLVHTIDWYLVACWFALLVIGWLSVYSSSHSVEGSGMFALAGRSGKQLLWMGISMVVGTVILFWIKPYLWEEFALPGWIFVVLLLGLVLVFGSTVNGSKSWFHIGALSFQPCELSKITTSLVLAHLLRTPGFRLGRFRDLAMTLAVVGIPAALILAGGEAGTLLVYVGYVFMLYREGLSGWWLVFLFAFIVLFVTSIRFPLWVSFVLLFVALGAYFLVVRRRVRGIVARRDLIWTMVLAGVVGSLMILSTSLVFKHVLKPHQQTRIEVLLGMKEDPMGAGYNVNQSMIAIGSGGLTGKGFLQGTQTAYGFVPEQSTDFIFCTIGEEFGFLGCALVILLYVFLIARILGHAEHCREPFARIYGYCLSGCFFMHMMINIGMTIGLMPVIGIPLPFISYGGSSMLSFTVMLFIFLALLKQERRYF